jgi:nitrogen fixation protein NifU and related proteins
MTDLRDLYQQSILDHYRNPRNFIRLERANRQADGSNPLCGDKVSIFMQIENGIIHDIGFAGTGCAICIASASMMTERLKGITEAEADALIESFCQMLASPAETANTPLSMGNLEVFSSVRGYPVRMKCATLAWHAARTALKGLQKSVSIK